VLVVMIVMMMMMRLLLLLLLLLFFVVVSGGVFFMQLSCLRSNLNTSQILQAREAEMAALLGELQDAYTQLSASFMSHNATLNVCLLLFFFFLFSFLLLFLFLFLFLFSLLFLFFFVLVLPVVNHALLPLAHHETSNPL
jgi:hypothetical protein